MNEKYEEIKNDFIKLCREKDIPYTDELIYLIFSEYPVATMDINYGTIDKCKQGLKEDYNTLWDLQPTIEEDEENAFAIQHARDIYDVLLGR